MTALDLRVLFFRLYPFFWSIEKANRPVFSVCRVDEDGTSKVSCLLFNSYIRVSVPG